jgi:vacuolar-type H+-ATPase subunit F/Vma7
VYNVFKKREYMKYTVKIFMLFGIVVQVAFAQTQQIRTQEFPQEQLKKQNVQIAALAAAEMAKTLPQKVDKYTTITNIKNDGTTLVYTFEINTGAKSDAAVKKEDHSRMQKAITQGVCKSSNKFLLAGINTTYIYRSAKTKKMLFQFKITKDKCTQIANK